MAVFTDKSTYSPEDLKFVSTMDIPVFDLKSAEAANTFDTKLRERDLKRAEENFKSIMDTQDQLLGLRYDNPEQFAVYEKLKQEVGLTPNTFATLDANSLQSPFEARGIGGRLKQMMARPEFIEVQKSVFDGDLFRKSVSQVADPELRARAMQRYEDYRAGKIPASSLNIGDYKSVDLTKELIDTIKLVPEITTSDFYTSESGNLEGVKTSKQRHADAVNKAISDRIKIDPNFAENMKAKGWMDEDGNITQDFIDVRDGYVDQWTQENTTIDNVKEVTETDKENTYGYGSGRFSQKDASGRIATALDRDLEDRGYELPDRGTVLSAAESRGRISSATRDEPTLGIKIGDPVLVGLDSDGKPYIITKLRKLTKEELEQRETAKYAMDVDFNGEAFNDLTNLIAAPESEGNYDAVGIPSDKSVAVGKYQFMFSYFAKDVKKILDSLGVDYKNVKVNPKINNSSKNMDTDMRKLASAFLNSPEAQEMLWKQEYAKEVADAHELAAKLKTHSDYKSNDGAPYSIAELMYIRHHEGSVSKALSFIRNDKSAHDTAKNDSTGEIRRALKKIRATLKSKGYTGEIDQDGGMMKTFKATPMPTLLPTGTPVAQPQDTFNVMDIPTE